MRLNDSDGSDEEKGNSEYQISFNSIKENDNEFDLKFQVIYEKTFPTKSPTKPYREYDKEGETDFTQFKIVPPKETDDNSLLGLKREREKLSVQQMILKEKEVIKKVVLNTKSKGRKTNEYKKSTEFQEEIKNNKRYHGRETKDCKLKTIKKYFQLCCISLINTVFETIFGASFKIRKLMGAKFTQKIDKNNVSEYFTEGYLLKDYFSREVAVSKSNQDKEHNIKIFNSVQSKIDSSELSLENNALLKFLMTIDVPDTFKFIFRSENLKDSPFLKEKLGMDYYEKYGDILRKVETSHIIIEKEKEKKGSSSEDFEDIEDLIKEGFLETYQNKDVKKYFRKKK
ncbi:MAG: hypothetical protein MJ252_14660 [archaeon]|nr:hypothetical protein [archaeon]